MSSLSAQAPRPQTPGDRRIPCQGAYHRPFSRKRVRGRVLGRAHPRPAPQRRRDPGGQQERALGPPRRRRRQGVRAPLRGGQGEEAGRHQAQAGAEAGRRALSRHRRGSRGGIDRLAPARGPGPAQAGAGQAHGVPRDHRRGHPAGPRQHPRARRPAGRRPGGPSHPRPALRLRGLARAVAQGAAEAVGRTGPERRHPDPGGAGAGPDAVPDGVVLERGGHVREAGHNPGLRRHPRHPRRHPPGHRQGLRRVGQPAEGLDPGPARPRGGDGPGRPPGRGRLRRAVGGREALPAQPVPAVHDVHPPAGGRSQAALHRPAHHVDRPAAVRERLHHLHAHRQHVAVGDGGVRCPAAGGRAVRARRTSPRRPVATRRR